MRKCHDSGKPARSPGPYRDRKRAITFGMAIPRVKSTYALDLDTVQALDDLARRWGVSKSEALRRLIRSAAEVEGAGGSGPLAALEALQDPAHLPEAKAGTWGRAVRGERDAAPPRGGGSAGVQYIRGADRHPVRSGFSLTVASGSAAFSCAAEISDS